MDCEPRCSLAAPDVLWRPKINKEALAVCQLMRKIERKHGIMFDNDYFKFHRWTCDHYADFWEEFWNFAGIVHSEPYSEVIDPNKTIADIPTWFSGAKMNYAENLLAKGRDSDTALIFAGEKLEGGAVEEITYADLREKVRDFANGMKSLGIEQGDRIAGYIPNCIESVVAMLAAASLGAVWTSTSPDFGVQGVVERLTQVNPRLLFTVEAVVYNGKRHNHLDKVAELVKSLDSLEHTIVIPFVDLNDNLDISSIPKSMKLSNFLSRKNGHNESVHKLTFTQVLFNHPLFIMFSSGTTGVPKCIVHSVGGTLMKHLAEHILQTDISSRDVIFFYSTTGWMMWNWLVSALALGATVVLYDGSPFVPTPQVFFDLTDKIGISYLGMGAKIYAVMEEKGLIPNKTHSLRSLRGLLSTGSPLKPASFDYIYRSIKEDVLIGSISGGTDIIACFMGGSWLLPVHRGEVQCPYLGCDIQSWSEDRKRLVDSPGELVCVKPFPSMPVQFLNDKDGIKYKKAYFAKFDGVWAHGDFCQISSSSGGIQMLGRSDGTLNPGGVRFGSADIYHVVESIPGVADSLCVGQSLANGDERVVLFLKLAAQFPFSESLVAEVQKTIRLSLSAKHIPAVILPIEDIPYTVSGKKVEIAVKQIIKGQIVANAGALSNPKSLDLFKNIPELAV